ncbi:MAG: beta-lactamase family protein [Betaproteobacteria bacterium]|nr:beta-lactamase family protein [Betaproteobacteria bacterium]
MVQGAIAQDEKLAADAPRTTPHGTTFIAPGGWTLAQSANMVVLTPPENDSKLALFDVEAKDADGALAAAWAAFRPGFSRPLTLATPQAPRDGWEERQSYDYETSPNEKLTVFAAAWRAGSAWTVILVEATRATHDKRRTLFGTVFASLRPKGYQRENFSAQTARPLDKERIAAMKAFVADAMRQLEIPGVAFSLIDGGKVVFQGGLGVKALGRPEKVDADTLFMAASNTKAMTTLLIAELVDAKKLRWDEPVIEALPAFRLGDADTTRKVLVKHLVCACTGLPRQDLEWLFEFRRATPASTLALLGSMQPTSGFGEVYQYSNVMAAAAGYLAASVFAPGREQGRAYDEAMRARVFRPLGMGNTTFDFARAQAGNHARPHGFDADARQQTASMDINYAIVPVRPAGGMWTSARDLSKYVQMELAGGLLPGGRRLVSQENLVARRAPQIAAGEDATYGMGLFVDTRWGIPIVSHGGSMPGYRSNMLWLPDHGVGAVILTNSYSGGSLLGPFARKLVEILFDAKSESTARVSVAAAETSAWIAKNRERLEIPAESAEAGRLAPRYSNAALGELAVMRKAGVVRFDFGEWRSTVASRRNDDRTVSFVTIDPVVAGFNFVVGERDGTRALILRDAQHEYAFWEVSGK